MAAVVRVRCGDTCGDVEVSSLQITVAVWPEQMDSSTYSFKCPTCGLIQVWAANALTQNRLMMVGSRVRYLKLPPRDTPEDVSPLTYDDLLELMLESEGVDTLAEFLDEKEKDEPAEEG